MENIYQAVVVDIAELLDPADSENERAALDASVSAEVFETIADASVA